MAHPAFVEKRQSDLRHAVLGRAGRVFCLVLEIEVIEPVALAEVLRVDAAGAHSARQQGFVADGDQVEITLVGIVAVAKPDVVEVEARLDEAAARAAPRRIGIALRSAAAPHSSRKLSA